MLRSASPLAHAHIGHTHIMTLLHNNYNMVVIFALTSMGGSKSRRRFSLGLLVLLMVAQSCYNIHLAKGQQGI